MAASQKTRSVLFECLANFGAGCCSFRANLGRGFGGGNLRAKNPYFCFMNRARKPFFLLFFKKHTSHWFSCHRNPVQAFLHSPATGSRCSLRSRLLRTRHPSAPPSRVISPSIIMSVGTSCGKCIYDQAGEGPQESKAHRT